MRTVTRLLQGWVARKSGLILMAFGVVALIAAIPASRVEIDTALEHLMMRDDPERIRNRDIKEEFSNDEILVIAFDVGRPFGADDLEKLGRFSERLAEIDGVEEVLDLSTIEDVRGDGERIDGSALVDFAVVAQEIDAIRRRASGHRLYDRNLVSPDQHVLALICILELGPDGGSRNFEVIEAVLGVLDAEGPGWPPHLSGYPYSEVDANRIMTRDLVLLTSVAFLIVLGITFASTRRFAPVAAMAGLATFAQVVCAAWFGMNEIPFTIVTAILPTVLLATTCTYGIYLFGLLGRFSDAPEPAMELLAHIVRPTLLASVSTSVGFLALRTMPVDVLSQLGTGLAIGIVAAEAAALLAIPAAIQRYDIRIPSAHLGRLEGLGRLGCRLAQQPIRVICVAAVITAIAAAGWSHVRLDSDPLSYWSEESDHRQSARFVRENLAGTLPINIVLRAPEAGAILEHDALALASELIALVEADPHVDRTLSFLDYLGLMDAAMRPGKPERAALPSREVAAQYMLLYEMGGDPDDYRHYINHERSALNIFVRINDRSSSVALGLRDEILHYAAKHAPVGVDVEVLGTWLLFPKAMDAITRGMVSGLLLAAAAIFMVMLVSLRDWRLALVAMVPNLLPIAVCGGLLGWLGIPLSFATSIVGCVALGLAVDDTAHVLGHVRVERSLESVYRMVSPALVMTTVALGTGFSVLALSEFVPVVHLGIAATLTLCVALLCDLLVLPSLLTLLGFRISDSDSAPQPGEEWISTSGDAAMLWSPPPKGVGQLADPR